MKIQCFCSTTDQYFVATAQWYVCVGATTFAWVYCPYCDDHRRTAKDTGYDPLAPQPHCQYVEKRLAPDHNDPRHEDQQTASPVKDNALWLKRKQFHTIPAGTTYLTKA